MNHKRALVVGIGALRGAYDAGVLSVLFDTLGTDYFDTIYASSVGVFQSAFAIAGQADIGEKIWREKVHSRQLIRPWNPLLRRPILDLPYLIGVFQREETRLDTALVAASSTRLVYTVTELATGSSHYVTVNEENIFRTMMASAALPLLHPAVNLDGNKFVDGGLSDPLPIERAIADGHTEITVVYNKPKGFLIGNRFRKTARLIARGATKNLRQSIIGLDKTYARIEELLEQSSIQVIRPNIQLSLRSITDTNHQRLIQTIDQGRSDAKRTLSNW